jgi:LuxR family quorum-sensing system transcriptional regulator CciR
MGRSLDRHIDALSRATSLVEAARHLVDLGKAIGLDRPAVVEDFSKERLIMSREGGLLGEVFGWLPAQAPVSQTPDVKGEPIHHVCPIGRACRVTVHPFAWRSADISSAPFFWDRRSRDFWTHAANLGIIGGVTVPVHMPLSRVGAVGWLATDHPVDLDAIVERWSNQLRLAAYLFMDHVYRERPDAAGKARDAALSERELECLTWVALGKTDGEIGELIGRSPSTARFHVDSAVEKLGVNNRTRAAAVACQLGMIRALA